MFLAIFGKITGHSNLKILKVLYLTIIYYNNNNIDCSADKKT